MSLKMGKNYSNRFLALWALIKAVILPQFKVILALPLPNIQQ